jgi:phospholipase/carboxylesterase
MKEITLAGTKVLLAGDLENPKTALVLLHGRGATAESIVALTDHVSLPTTCVVLAPQAPQNTWYPERFIVPKSANEPGLTNSLAVVENLVKHIREEFRLAHTEVVLAGFSQGACLAAEYLKQQPRRYRGAAIMSGGLIGTTDEVLDIETTNSLEQTPIYLVCDSQDFHIPAKRVEETEMVLRRLEAVVEMRWYEGLGHTIHPEALAFIASHIQ